ncbi:Pbgs [Bugula neritina]|uniref:porphobilinogen synthase n=1 Tax=Bugula neritina TaxID=10212 RepID=A0A7J7ITK9_BUGNE|nr:Pbgs [Bugula neritina]
MSNYSGFKMSRFLHSGYHHPVLRIWQAGSSTNLADALLYPIFISDEDSCIENITTLPGQKRFGIQHLNSVLSPLVDDGLKAVLLFGVITKLDKHVRAVHLSYIIAPCHVLTFFYKVLNAHTNF